MAKLTLKNLQKDYGDQTIIHGLDLAVNHGELIVVVGPSGCGKSTLLRMVAGLETVSGGDIFIDDRNVNRLEPKERNIAMVFQNYALYPHMSVFENLAYGLRRRGINKQKISERVHKTAAILGLSELLTRRPNELSGGQRQRVAMGRAIVRKPAIFLFDEPLSNLDANLRVQMRLEIKKLQQELNITSLYVTHDQVEAMTLADRLVVMNRGKVEQIGTPTELYHTPSSTFVGGFLGSPPMNFLNAAINDQGNAVKLHNDVYLPLPKKQPCNNHAGKPITLGIRPESILTSSKQCADQFQLKVGLVEVLGAETLVYGNVPGDNQKLTIRLPVNCRPAIGEIMTLGVMPDSLHLFDKESRLRIV